MKTRLCLLVVTLCVGLLASCGSGSSADSSSSTSSSSSSMVESSMDSAFTSTTLDSTAMKEAKFIYTAQLKLETTTFEDSITAITDLVDELGGYIESSSVVNQGSYRNGAYTVRIPAALLSSFTAQAGEICLAVYSSTTAEDISFEYYDTQGRLTTQEIKMGRLQALLEQAETMEDLLTIEDAISQTQWEIDNLSGAMTYYDAQVDYAAITMSIQEVTQLSNVKETPIGFGGRISEAFSDGISDFVDGLEDMAVFVAYSWIPLLIVGGVIGVAVGVTLGKKKRDSVTPPKA